MKRQLVGSFARLVGLAFVFLGLWVLSTNLLEPGEEAGYPALVLGMALAGAAGGVLYLLSFDGPPRFRRVWVRLLGWLGMVVLAALPWSYQPVMLLLVAAVVPGLLPGRSDSPPAV